MYNKRFSLIGESLPKSVSESRDKLQPSDDSSIASLTCHAMPLGLIRDRDHCETIGTRHNLSASVASNGSSTININDAAQSSHKTTFSTCDLHSNESSEAYSDASANVFRLNDDDDDIKHLPHVHMITSTGASSSSSTRGKSFLSSTNSLINGNSAPRMSGNAGKLPAFPAATRATRKILAGKLESLSSSCANSNLNATNSSKSLVAPNKFDRDSSVSFSYRSSKFERILVISVALFATATLIMSLALVSILMSPTFLRQDKDDASKPTTMSIKEAESMLCLTPSCIKVAASIIEAIDESVDPCQNFYLYSCGDWIKQNPLPDGKINWGAFNKLWQDNQAIMRSVLESTDLVVGSAEHKAKIYYEACLDKNGSVDAKGSEPIQELIESAGGWNISGHFNVDDWDLQSALQIYHNQFNRGGLFSWAVGTDERNSSRNVIQLDQGGLGLPSRDYFINNTNKNVVDAYFSYMVKIAELMGCKDCEPAMKDVLEFETAIASIMLPQDQRRNDETMYHKYSLKEFTQQAPFLNWTKYFDDAYEFHSKTSISFSSQLKKLPLNYTLAYTNHSSQTEHKSEKPSMITRKIITQDEYAVVYSPEYFQDLTTLLRNQMKTARGKITVANYLGWSVIQSLTPSLPESFRDASKVLRKTLMGSEGIEPNWRWCVTDTNQVMGFALGAMFVRKVFKGESKARVEEMINSIREAFQENMDSLEWMDSNTRQLAREKADHIKQMIGFPEFIMNSERLGNKYEGLELEEDNYFGNNIKVNVLSLRENMERINKPSNRTEWEMTPPMVNAYYTPTKNQIVLPAGILQTPFYNLAYPDSLNYGAMGVVLGHELTHAFDDQGREYDKDGNLEKWWYNETLRNFEERVKCLVDQYNDYKIDDNHINGKQTLGENIADNGGLKAAFRAYSRWADKHPSPRLPGLNLTNSQLFFVGFAQVWCSNSTPEALRLQILNDVHAPAEYRVIGTLSNSEDFVREFDCPTNSKMNAQKKCTVW